MSHKTQQSRRRSNGDWTESQRSSSTNALMMAREELNRKKRLGKIKSTISNHLHPAVEKRITSKKKTKVSRVKCFNKNIESSIATSDLREDYHKANFQAVDNDSRIPIHITASDSVSLGFSPEKSSKTKKYASERSNQETSPVRNNFRLPDINPQRDAIRGLLSARSDSSLTMGREEASCDTYGRNALDLFDAEEDDSDARDSLPRSDTAPPALCVEKNLSIKPREEKRTGKSRNRAYLSKMKKSSSEPIVLKDGSEIPLLKLSIDEKHKKRSKKTINQSEEIHKKNMELERSGNGKQSFFKTNNIVRKEKGKGREPSPEYTHSRNEQLHDINTSFRRPNIYDNPTIIDNQEADSITRQPPTQPKKRNSHKSYQPKYRKNAGSSLAELRKEHLDALEMLRTLGGPIDSNYLNENIDSLDNKNIRSTSPSCIDDSEEKDSIDVERDTEKSTNRPESRRSTPGFVPRLRRNVSGASHEKDSNQDTSVSNPIKESRCLDVDYLEEKATSTIPTDLDPETKYDSDH